MLPLYALPGLPKTRCELKGFSEGLHVMYVRRGTIDSLVRFSADSSLIGPIKKKN